MKTKLTRAETIAKNKIDRAIDEIYRRRCSGIAINIMDIPQVFKAGHKAAAEGRDIEAAVVDTVAVLKMAV
jgi:hypothetical protein